jgi:hypothetical protein
VSPEVIEQCGQRAASGAAWMGVEDALDLAEVEELELISALDGPA